jgi:alpha-glucosidase
LRRRLIRDEHFAWVDTGDPQVLRFARSDGWHCMVNFSTRSVRVPGRLLLTSEPERQRADTAYAELSPEATAWFEPGPAAQAT